MKVEQPWWLHVVFARTSAGSRVRFVLSQGRSITPLAMYATADFDKLNSVVGAARRHLQLLGRSA